MAMIGGDLGAMAALARRFQTAGETFQGQTGNIASRVDAALQEFVEAMRTLDGEARELANEINGEMVRLNGMAASTSWTGTNRERMDGVVATLDDDIVRIRAAIEAFVDEASSVVNGSLTSSLNQLRTNVEQAGTQAATIASGFSGSVDGQRAAFDQVMNG